MECKEAYESNRDLEDLAGAIEILTIYSKESPNCLFWAEYEIENDEKVYTDYEVIRPNATEPTELSTDRYETVSVDDLLKWYKKRYTQKCEEDYLMNEINE